MKRLIVGIAAGLLLAACSGNGDGDGNGDEIQAEPATTPTTVPVTTAAPRTLAPTTTIEETFTMPNLVGWVLQDAQDKLQSLGAYSLDQEDARGLERLQVQDSNWKVCSQKPRARAVVPVSTTVVLASVKLSERCP